jgi:hypothetical protein
MFKFIKTIHHFSLLSNPSFLAWHNPCLQISTNYEKMILKLLSFLLLLYGGATILPAIREITLIKKMLKRKL